jgi:hypothetical protein
MKRAGGAGARKPRGPSEARPALNGQPKRGFTELLAAAGEPPAFADGSPHRLLELGHKGFEEAGSRTEQQLR